MKECKAFKMENREDIIEHLKNLVTVEKYGDMCNGHCLHTWDDGYRTLKWCPKCEAFVLYQFSEYHSFTDGDDSYYQDYFPVSSREEARKLNEKYDGFKIEKVLRKKCIFL